MNSEERNKFVEENLKLVHSRISHLAPAAFKDRDYYNDLFQEGVLGFLEGLGKFKEGKGCVETTYCVFRIDARIKRFKRKNRMIIIPSIQYSKTLKYRRYYEELGYGRDDIKKIMELNGREDQLYFSLIRMLTTNTEDGRKVMDYRSDHYPDFVLERDERNQMFKELFDSMSEKERIFIEDIFGFSEEEKSIAELAGKCNVSRQYLCKLKKQILGKLKKELVSKDYAY